MLHLKQPFCLDDNFSIIPYKKSFFGEILLFFKKFQSEAKISSFQSNCSDFSSAFYEDYLISELSKIILKSDFCYVVYDNNKGHISSFFSFKRDLFMPDSINIELVIYNPDRKSVV